VRTFELVIDSKTYQVEIGDTTQRPVEVTVNGKAYVVESINQRSSAPALERPAPAAVATARPEVVPQTPRPAPRDRATAHGGTNITAPMPGKILSIKVKVGDQVEKEDVVCTLEAMKMEMAINATASGTIVQVSVEAGQTVNHGETLCVIG